MSIIQGSAMQGASRGFYPKTINGSLRFNKSDTAYLEWTPDSAGNRKTWTFSCWVKYCIESTDGPLFTCFDGDNNNRAVIAFDNGEELAFTDYSGGTAKKLMTDQEFKDPSAWYHIVVRFDSTQATASDRTRFYVNGTKVTSFRANNENYVAQNHDGSMNRGVKHLIGGHSTVYLHGYMAEVFFLDGQSKAGSDFGETKNGVWVPKDITASDFTMGTNGFHLTFEDDTEVEAFNTLLWDGNDGTQSITGAGFSPDLVWMKRRTGTSINHMQYDTVRGPTRSLQSSATNAESDRTTGLTSFDSDGFTVGAGGAENSSGNDFVAWCWDAGANNASTGHSSVIYTGSSVIGHRISGLPFRPDLLWLKIRSGQADNHVWQDSVRGPTKRLFSNSSAAESTASEVTSFTDDGFILGSTDGSSNYTGFTYVGWAWDAGDSDPVSNTDGSITSTVKSNGYFSIISYSGSGADATVGHGLDSAPDFFIIKNRDRSAQWSVYHQTLGATKFVELSTTAAAATDEPSFNDTEPTDTVFSVGAGSNGTNASGEDLICYAWRDETGKQKFDTYSGDGTTDGSNEVTTGFRVGFLMVKRTDAAGHWIIMDATRSPFNNVGKKLLASSTEQEIDDADLVEFTDTGFKLRDNGTGTGSPNINNATYIYAAFAGSYSDFITDFNTDGSIDSRVKASDTTGFSIVSYVGTGANATVGHGLSSAPDWIVIKDRPTVNDWPVWHTSLANTEYLKLNGANAKATGATVWNSTSPTATTFSLGSSNLANNSGKKHIAYCWTATTGVSAFGSYTGTGATGNSITGLGFKPAWLIVKKTEDTNGSWRIFDATRSTTDDRNDNLFANLSNAESVDSNGGVSFDSDGFTLNNTGSANANENNKNYIYAAFADTREAAFWLDQSSNDNDWQPNNLDHNDTVLDSPTDNFATFNPQLLAKSSATAYRTFGDFSEGNLLLTTNADNESGTVSFGATSGKYYMEFTSENLAQRQQIIVYSTDDFRSDTGAVTTSSDGGGNATDRVSWTTGDVIGIAVDVDNSKVFIHKNGDYFGTSNPVTNTGGDTLNSFTGVGVRQDSGSTGSAKISFNAGQQPFKYGPPE